MTKFSWEVLLYLSLTLLSRNEKDMNQVDQLFPAGKFDPYDSVIPSLDQLLAIPIDLQKKKKTKAKGSTQHHCVLTTILQVGRRHLLRKHLLRRHPKKKEGQNW